MSKSDYKFDSIELIKYIESQNAIGIFVKDLCDNKSYRILEIPFMYKDSYLSWKYYEPSSKTYFADGIYECGNALLDIFENVKEVDAVQLFLKLKYRVSIPQRDIEFLTDFFEGNIEVEDDYFRPAKFEMNRERININRFNFPSTVQEFKAVLNDKEQRKKLGIKNNYLEDNSVGGAIYIALCEMYPYFAKFFTMNIRHSILETYDEPPKEESTNERLAPHARSYAEFLTSHADELPNMTCQDIFMKGYFAGRKDVVWNN